MKLRIEDLPKMEVYRDGDAWGVRTDRYTFLPIDERHALLIAAAGPMFKILASCNTPQSPLYADLATLWNRIELEPDDGKTGTAAGSKVEINRAGTPEVIGDDLLPGRFLGGRGYDDTGNFRKAAAPSAAGVGTSAKVGATAEGAAKRDAADNPGTGEHRIRAPVRASLGVNGIAVILDADGLVVTEVYPGQIYSKELNDKRPPRPEECLAAAVALATAYNAMNPP